jgi:hypothetical protein
MVAAIMAAAGMQRNSDDLGWTSARCTRELTSELFTCQPMSTVFLSEVT